MEHEIEDEEVGKMGGCHSGWSTSIMGPQCLTGSHMLSVDLSLQVGVQDDGFPILSVDKPGWWWVVHTCNDIYKLEPAVKEDTVTGWQSEVSF